jgi:acyl-[acyl-carrier-protein]-phospholipid O-acyltransferase/long-chain-fatty-acid--[acyl-carrier-protein] ligase
VDLGHKITIQNSIFKVYDGNTQIILAAIINSLILLPFILLFSPAGIIADRYPKHRVMQFAAWAAVLITLGITCCYYQGWFWTAFALTLLLSMKSAIYSPAKYGYIKTLFGKQHLAEANGVVQATTISAILLGTFAFSILFEYLFPAGSDTSHGLMAVAPIGWLLVINSIIELLMAYRLPQLDTGDHTEIFKYHDLISSRSLVKNIQPVLGNRIIRHSVIGLAVFWSVGQVLLAAFPAFAKETLAVNNTIVIQGILAATGMGIALGSTLAGRWSKKHIETSFIPLGAAGISLGLMLLPFIGSLSGHFFNFLFIGIMGGLFIVPLNALLQFNAGDRELGRVIAGNNLIQNISMLSFLVLTVLFALAGISTGLLLTLIALTAIAGCGYTLYQLPQSLARILFTVMTGWRYALDIQGVNYIPSQGAVLLFGHAANRWDWALLQTACPRPIHFMWQKDHDSPWYLKIFFKHLIYIAPTSTPNSPASQATMAALLKQGEVVCVLREEAISPTAHQEEFQDYVQACGITQSDIRIIPFYLQGMTAPSESQCLDTPDTHRVSAAFREITVNFDNPICTAPTPQSAMRS